MAMRLLSLLIWLTLSASVSISTSMAEKANDKAALLAFKAAAISGGYDDPLASWNGSTGAHCSWEGVRCRGRHRRVVALSLPYHRLTGVLSPAIGNLSSLRTLNLSSNVFSGDIPASLGRLRRLHLLDLSHNNFSGEFPINLTSCINLTTMYIRFNQLHGHLPSEIGEKLLGLRILTLAQNNLTGTIPASLGNLSSLFVLELAFNQLEGTIPSSLGDIPGIRFLGLAFNNLSGEPPLSLYNMSSLRWLQIQGNKLHGSIPIDIGTRFPNMQMLVINTNNFTGPIPASLSNLTALQVLHLGQNSLSGYVPSMLGRLRALKIINLSITMLEADDKEGWEFISSLANCSQLQRLELSGNAAFTGQLPSSMTNLSTSLQILRFDATGISGSIPSAIGNLVGLQVLGASNNTLLSGVIPESISKLGNLVVLDLFNVHLSGLIPSSIGNLSKLNSLDARHAKLEGAIPASLGKLDNLVHLDLSRNHLNGSVPIEIFNLTLLSNFLDLSYNSLSGSIPSQVGTLRNLNNMVLSGNRLSGEIPDSIGECTVLQQLQLDNNLFKGIIPQSLWKIKGLSTLNLSMNKLSGTIPDGIGSVKNLQQLYLVHNNLSGPIPAVLENMTSLSELDLSFNNLQGEVPKEGIFRNMTRFSITGNRELCGGIPQLHLGQCKNNTVKKNRTRRLKDTTIAVAISGAVFVVAIVLAVFQLLKKFRRKQKDSFLAPINEEQYQRVSYYALSNGTDGFSEANLLGKGSFGAVYKCTFQGEGTIVAVKVFDIEQSGSIRSFVAECKALKRVRHRCLIKIITCCSSINNQGQDFKALVLEFMPNGNLNDWLHPKSDIGTLRNTLTLEQRLGIAVDIIDALEYLHNHCQPPIVHCDLKPSNILLAQDMSARVGDFGISRILPECVSETLQNSNSTIGIKGSIGYVAPEYGEGSSISTLGDVYSLGILLLELFTGRSPTDDMFRGPLDLHKFAEDAFPERIWEIVDTTMWLDADTYDNTKRSKTENCLVSVIALGISCSKKQPKERTLIESAAAEIHAIRDSYHIFVRSVAASE
ncbi:hypothetical protein EJB05_50963, partial [Eragrostis curvula]